MKEFAQELFGLGKNVQTTVTFIIYKETLILVNVCPLNNEFKCK